MGEDEVSAVVPAAPPDRVDRLHCGRSGRLGTWAGMMMGIKLPVACVCSALCLGLLVSCAGSPPPGSGSPAGSTDGYRQTPDGSYRVRRGDTLHSIAFRFSVDWREIASLNGISSPYTIYPDQMLRLSLNPLAASDEQSESGGVAQTTAAPPPSAAATRPLDTPGTSSTTVAPTESGLETPASEAEAVAVAVAVATAPMPPDASGESGGASSQSQPGPSTPSASANREADTAPGQTQPVASTPPAVPTRVPEMSVPTTAVGDPARWLWPTEGRLLSSFRADDAARKGIDIGGQKGQPVIATAPGLVVYSGSGLIGYGELIIIKHSDRMLSAYAHNSKRLVSEGQQVGAGSHIAEMGINDRNQALLHFEIRVNGSPQDPLKFLPRR